MMRCCPFPPPRSLSLPRSSGEGLEGETLPTFKADTMEEVLQIFKDHFVLEGSAERYAANRRAAEAETAEAEAAAAAAAGTGPGRP
jgi:hypothetical protein